MPVDAADAVAAVSGRNGANRAPGAVPASSDDDAPPPVDEAAESAFLAEARDRGETVRPVAAVEPIEETDAKELPPLDTLVQQIPANVREVLDDLFRAKFVRVQRVPKKALKG